MTLTFRPAVPEDVPACVILRGLTRENAIPVERLAAMGITEESWAADVRSDALPGYVCCDDGAIAGYCFGDKASGEVVVLALLPAYEERGIGRHLLGLVVEPSRRGSGTSGCSSAALPTRPPDPTASIGISAGFPPARSIAPATRSSSSSRGVCFADLHVGEPP